MSSDRHLRAVDDSYHAPDGVTLGTSGTGEVITPRGLVRAANLDSLLTQAARGSGAAFEQIYDNISGAVYGTALRVVRDPQLAEDVAQEALVEVWRTAARFRPDAGSARAWILTIAHRRAVDRVRSEQAHTTRLRHHGKPDDKQAPTDNVVDTMFAEWEAARVRAGLAELTELQREAIILAYYKGYTHREVSEALDIPLGTAKARLRDGLMKLRDMWEVAR